MGNGSENAYQANRDEATRRFGNSVLEELRAIRKLLEQLVEEE